MVEPAIPHSAAAVSFAQPLTSARMDELTRAIDGFNALSKSPQVRKEALLRLAEDLLASAPLSVQSLAPKPGFQQTTPVSYLNEAAGVLEHLIAGQKMLREENDAVAIRTAKPAFKDDVVLLSRRLNYLALSAKRKISLPYVTQAIDADGIDHPSLQAFSSLRAAGLQVLQVRTLDRLIDELKKIPLSNSLEMEAQTHQLLERHDFNEAPFASLPGEVMQPLIALQEQPNVRNRNIAISAVSQHNERQYVPLVKAVMDGFYKDHAALTCKHRAGEDIGDSLMQTGQTLDLVNGQRWALAAEKLAGMLDRYMLTLSDAAVAPATVPKGSSKSVTVHSTGLGSSMTVGKAPELFGPEARVPGR